MRLLRVALRSLARLSSLEPGFRSLRKSYVHISGAEARDHFRLLNGTNEFVPFPSLLGRVFFTLKLSCLVAPSPRVAAIYSADPDLLPGLSCVVFFETGVRSGLRLLVGPDGSGFVPARNSLMDKVSPPSSLVETPLSVRGRACGQGSFVGRSAPSSG
jgi:hypothetical protein